MKNASSADWFAVDFAHRYKIGEMVDDFSKSSSHARTRTWLNFAKGDRISQSSRAYGPLRLHGEANLPSR
ncbi:hypothetical protein [Persicirhabdus sediminis]|nr:hypothetical protein [Persicirhabdus sediminis]